MLQFLRMDWAVTVGPRAGFPEKNRKNRPMVRPEDKLAAWMSEI